jgi:geranylgeranyl reductase family protein
LEVKQFDVIVVGGGPSGLYTASFLADYGLSIALFEEDSEIGKDVVCSGVISKEAFSRYDLPEEAIVGRLKEAELFSPSGIRIPYSHPEEAAVVVDRHVFDKRLGEIACRKGAEIWLNTKVTSLLVEDKFVEAHLKTQDGEKKIYAEVAVIATGVKFNLQTALGLGRPKKIIKGVQIEVTTEQVERLRIYFGNRFSRDFFGWAIPLIDGRTRVGVMTEGNAIEGLKNTLSKVTPYTDSCMEINKIKRKGIAFGTIPRSYSNRIIAIGEAAGHIKTTTGGGIYYGLISAEIASEIIKKAFKKKNFEAKTLSEYEKIWKGSLGREIAFGEYFHKFYSKLDDYSIDKLFYAAEQDGLLSFIAERGKFDWHKDVVIKILKSPNLRSVLWNGFIRQFTNGY